MEEKEIVNAQFEQERIAAMRANYEVFSCSGNQMHLHTCDGNCEVKKLNELEIEIIKEQVKWEELGMVPLGGLPQLPMMPGVPIDTLKTSMALSALTKMCVEKLGLDEDELDHKYQEVYLQKLRDIREANEDDMREAQRREGIAVPGAAIKPQIVVPDHIARKMH